MTKLSWTSHKCPATLAQADTSSGLRTKDTNLMAAAPSSLAHPPQTPAIQRPVFSSFSLLAACTLTILCAPAFAAAAADAHTALAQQRQRIETADYRISGRLINVDARGARATFGLTIKAHWYADALHIRLDVTSPATAREHVLLELRDNGQEEISVAHPGDSAMRRLPAARWSDGPGNGAFSFEDFLEPEYFWPDQNVEGETRRGARDCTIVRSRPSASDTTRYSEIRSWLDKTIGFPVYAEKTLKSPGLVKEFTSLGLRHDGGVWSASQVQVTVRGRPGSTILIIDRGTAHANLSAKDFAPAAALRFEGGL